MPLLREPLFYIFFIYGTSFLVMSYVVFHGIRKATSITLVKTFYALVIFGVLHGAAELTDWVRFIIHASGGGEVKALYYLSPALMFVSFVVLTQFGINLLTYKSGKKNILQLIPSVLVIAYICVIIAAKVRDVMAEALIARNGFGTFGALLSGVALLGLARSMKALGNKRLETGLAVSAAGFMLYAVFGGIIVNPVAGLPVQLFRAACALTIAASSFYILDVFKAG